MKKFIAFITLIFVCASGAYAQAGDTLAYVPGITTPDGIAGILAQITTQLPNANKVVTQWLPVALLILGIVQFTLKRIPTPFSVRLRGPLGWIADLLTAFQKDIRTMCIYLLIGVGVSMSLSSCFIQKDCHVTATTLNGREQNICLRCDSLAQDAAIWTEQQIKLRLKK
jgi:hypothetical protein